MNGIHGILVFGANGSGKTTLGHELAQKFNCKHMDVEDYYFLPSDIPYTVSRTKDEAIPLILADIEKYCDFVLSAVTGDFGEKIISKFDFAVCLTVPRGIRIDRIRKRRIEKYGGRLLPGGDMYDNNERFIEFAAMRPLDKIDDFARLLNCPVFYLDGTQPVEQPINKIDEIMKNGVNYD